MKLKELFEEFQHLYGTVQITPKSIENGHIKENYSKYIIDGDFDCYNQPLLTTLKGSPYQVKDLDLRACGNLKSLKGAPQIVTRNVFLGSTGITSLEGIGKDYFVEIGEELYLPIGTITSNILGLLKIKKLNRFVFFTREDKKDHLAYAIVSKYFEDKDIAKCRQELIETGFKEYAKL